MMNNQAMNQYKQTGCNANAMQWMQKQRLHQILEMDGGLNVKEILITWYSFAKWNETKTSNPRYHYIAYLGLFQKNIFLK